MFRSLLCKVIISWFLCVVYIGPQTHCNSEYNGEDTSDTWVKQDGENTNITQNDDVASKSQECGQQKLLEDLQKKFDDMRSSLEILKRFAHEQQTNSLSCPVGSMRYGCDCLLYVHRALKWSEAREHCADMSAKLVHVHSDSMQRNIKRFLKAQLGRRQMNDIQVFTGLIYTHETTGIPAVMEEQNHYGLADGWYWRGPHESDLRKQTNTSFSSWDKEHPNSTSILTKSCMTLQGNQLKWVSTYCYKKHIFICHFKAVSSGKNSQQCDRRRERKRRRKNKEKSIRERESSRKNRNSSDIENG